MRCQPFRNSRHRLPRAVAPRDHDTVAFGQHNEEKAPGRAHREAEAERDRALSAAEHLAGNGIDAEVIDVRSLVPLDIGSIEASVAKTGRLLIVEEDHLTAGWGAEVAALIAERGFHHLAGPVRRVAGPDTPIPCAASLEARFVPSVERIVSSATGMLGMELAGRRLSKQS